MALRTIQLQVTFGASFAAVAASEIYYRVVSYGGIQRIARTNSGVVSSSDGSFYAAPSIDDAWLPARVEWDNGGAAGLGSATRRASASIDPVSGGASVNEIVAALSGRKIVFNGPVLEDGSGVIDAGDEYTDPSRPLQWTIENWQGPNANGVDAELRFLPLNTYDEPGDRTPAVATFPVAITQSGQTLTLRSAPTSSQTLALYPATHAGGKALYRAKLIIPSTAWPHGEWSLSRIAMTVHRRI